MSIPVILSIIIFCDSIFYIFTPHEERNKYYLWFRYTPLTGYFIFFKYILNKK